MNTVMGYIAGYREYLPYAGVIISVLILYFVCRAADIRKMYMILAAEAIFLLLSVFTLNMYFFLSPSISLKPMRFMLGLIIRQGLLSLPLKLILVLGLVLVIDVVSFVVAYQALRKEIIDIRNRSKNTQGTASWAEKKDLVKTGLIGPEIKGLVLGQAAEAKAKALELDRFSIESTSDVIADDSPYHTLVVGATGAGKFVGVIGPTLLCPGNVDKSMIIVDPKGESYRITGGFRSRYTDVYYFNPVDKDSCHLNPLDFIPRDSSAVSRIKTIAIEIHPNNSKEKYWDEVPQQIIEMFIGHIILKGRNKSIPEITELMRSFPSYDELFQHVIDSYAEDVWDDNDPLKHVKDMVIADARRLLKMASGQDSDQFSTHFSAVNGDLSAYSTPEARECLSYSDFSLENICDGNRPMTLYFCCDVDNLKVVMPMFRLIFSLVMNSLLHKEKHKFRLWLFLDEFSQFKRWDFVKDQIPFVRSFGIRMIVFIQSIAQLNDIYTNNGADAMLDNFQIKLYLKATNVTTGQYFERMLGMKTILQKKTSMSSNRRSVGVESTTESTSEVGRSLLKADEILHLPSYEELIFHPVIRPYRGKKVQYFTDPRFRGNMNLEVLEPENKTKELPPPAIEEKPSVIHVGPPKTEKKAEEPLPSDEKLNEMMDKTMATPQPNLSAKEPDIPEGSTLNNVIERTFAAAEAPDDDISVSAPDEEDESESEKKSISEEYEDGVI